MRDFQNDSGQTPPPLASLLICPKCQSAMTVEMETPVALAQGIHTVTLVCNACGHTTIENCQADE